ncbi:MAG TPA: hypothetical protein DCL60_03645, partial [Armatimonadetes bacterium]|nr:hypothetical protein [Armatimonadota bacterium]
WVSNSAGSLQNIFDVTRGYGWKANRQLPDAELETDIPIVESAEKRAPVSLSINIVLSSPQLISSISILPMVRDGSGVYPTVESIEVWRKGSSTPYTIEAAQARTLTDELAIINKSATGGGIAFDFPAVNATQLRINLVAGKSYSVQIGHPYTVLFEEITHTTSLLISSSESPYLEQ